VKLYDEIQKHKKLKSALHILDFEIIKLDLRGSKLDISKESALEITSFAREATGGVFAFWKRQGNAIVHIDSEGRCGRFAADLEQALLFISSFPFSWMDLLHSSGHLKDMKEIIKQIETELAENIDPNSKMGRYYKEIGFDVASHQSEIKNAAELVKSELSLISSSNMLKEFSISLKRKPQFIVSSKDGNEYGQFSGQA